MWQTCDPFSARPSEEQMQHCYGDPPRGNKETQRSCNDKPKDKIARLPSAKPVSRRDLVRGRKKTGMQPGEISYWELSRSAAKPEERILLKWRVQPFAKRLPSFGLVILPLFRVMIGTSERPPSWESRPTRPHVCTIFPMQCDEHRAGEAHTIHENDLSMLTLIYKRDPAFYVALVKTTLVLRHGVLVKLARSAVDAKEFARVMVAEVRRRSIT